MKRNTKIYYHAESIDGYSGLYADDEEQKTPAGIRAAIDRANAKQKAADFRTLRYIIIRDTVETVRDDNGQFVCRSSFQTVTEIYPAEVDQTPYYGVKYLDAKYSNFGCEYYSGSYSKEKAIYDCNRIPGTIVVNRITGETVYTRQDQKKTKTNNTFQLKKNTIVERYETNDGLAVLIKQYHNGTTYLYSYDPVYDPEAKYLYYYNRYNTRKGARIAAGKFFGKGLKFKTQYSE